MGGRRRETGSNATPSLAVLRFGLADVCKFLRGASSVSCGPPLPGFASCLSPVIGLRTGCSRTQPFYMAVCVWMEHLVQESWFAPLRAAPPAVVFGIVSHI